MPCYGINIFYELNHIFTVNMCTEKVEILNISQNVKCVFHILIS